MSSTNRARALRQNQTETERILWSHIRSRRLAGHKFRRQRPLGGYIVDFVCFERRLIIEVDGGQHADQRTYDARRQSWLESQGFRVLRLWNNEVLSDIEAAKEAIYQALQEYPSP